MHDKQSGNCTFCKIIKGELEKSLVFEDEYVLAIMDIAPVNAGHVLIIPKLHAPHIPDLSDNMLGHMAKIGSIIAKAMYKSEVVAEGVNLFMADGEVAGQEVWHAHLHIIPRNQDDGFGLKHDPEKNFLRPPRVELEALAQKIRNAL